MGPFSERSLVLIKPDAVRRGPRELTWFNSLSIGTFVWSLWGSYPRERGSTIFFLTEDPQS